MFIGWVLFLYGDNFPRLCQSVRTSKTKRKRLRRTMAEPLIGFRLPREEVAARSGIRNNKAWRQDSAQLLSNSYRQYQKNGRKNGRQNSGVHNKAETVICTGKRSAGILCISGICSFSSCTHHSGSFLCRWENGNTAPPLFQEKKFSIRKHRRMRTKNHACTSGKL